MNYPKFRAWHTKQKEMFSPCKMGRDDLTLSSNGRGFINVSGKDTILSEHIPAMVPLQFTRLTDKHGADIYEGDIIGTEKAGYYVVEFKNGIFGYESLVGFVPLYDFPVQDCEVMGNIYENPEYGLSTPVPQPESDRFD